MHSWFLVCSSALLFSSAFLWPAYCFWAIFIFFIPLWHLFKRGQGSFVKGYMWGIICWSLQLSALLIFLFEHGSGSAPLRMSAWLVLVFYLSIYAGIWFWIIKVANDFFYASTVKSFIIISVSMAYFYWIHRAVFFIFGRVFGYPFSNPLLPLMIIPRLLLYPQPKEEWQNQIAIIAPHNYESAWDRAYDFLERCKKISNNKPAVKVIITPESAFPFPLNNYPEFIALWSEYPGFECIHFLIGAHRQEGKKLFNTLYYIHQGRIIQYYDKKTTLLIAEELPTNKFWLWTQKIFLADKHQVHGSINARKAITIDGLPKLLPYICSDLFFCYKNPKMDDAVILCTVNDGWFSMNYMKELLQLYVRLAAINLNKQILYIN